MKKAYYSAKADDIRGSASMLVMDGEIFVAASVGGYRAVLCTDGVATQLGAKHQRKQNRKWAVSGTPPHEMLVSVFGLAIETP